MIRTIRHRSFAAALRRYREEYGLTQMQLAERIGVAWRTLARWESGTSKPRGVLQVKAVEKLGISLKR